MPSYDVLFSEHRVTDRRLAQAQLAERDIIAAATERISAIGVFEDAYRKIVSGLGCRGLMRKNGSTQSFWVDEFATDRRDEAERTTPCRFGPLAKAMKAPCPICKARVLIIIRMEEYGIYSGNGNDLPTEETCYTFCPACMQSHKIRYPD
jgi:hypothetical protein